jgi:hypothetical protein
MMCACNAIETACAQKRVVRFNDRNDIASIGGIRCELSTAASSAFLACSSWAVTGESSPPQLDYRGNNHEENILDHRLGSSGFVCVGTEHTTAAYEDARRAAAAAPNHKHDHHYAGTGQNRVVDRVILEQD